MGFTDAFDISVVVVENIKALTESILLLGIFVGDDGRRLAAARLHSPGEGELTVAHSESPSGLQ